METDLKCNGSIYLSSKAAAQRWGMAEQTFANWRNLRKGPPYIRIGSKIVYRKADLIAYENENRIDPEAA